VNSLIVPLGTPRQKRGKQVLKCLIVDEFFKKQKGSPRVKSSFKEFLALVDAFRVFVVQQREATQQN
jgi:hypothetical protein